MTVRRASQPLSAGGVAQTSNAQFVLVEARASARDFRHSGAARVALVIIGLKS
jgi:hypothetical protein